MNTTLEQAEKIINAAKAKAVEMGVKMNIPLVDAGANQAALVRMGGV
jgi:uncharacterized protein GlcG (DUF336 family)